MGVGTNKKKWSVVRLTAICSGDDDSFSCILSSSPVISSCSIGNKFLDGGTSSIEATRQFVLL